MAEVSPLRNLPPASVPWGRAIEDSHRQTQRGIADLALMAQSQSRSNAGEAGVLGKAIADIGTVADRLQSSVQELTARRSQVLTVSAITTAVSTPSTGTTYTFTTSGVLNFDPSYDGEVRNAVVYITFEGYNSQPGNTSGTLRVGTSGMGSGRELYSDAMSNPRQTSTPSGWTDAVTLSGALRSANPTITLNVRGDVFRFQGSTTTTTLGIQNIRAVLLWGGK